jgi:hypothetical protein
MATIKTRTVEDQRRIITKVVGGLRRVSCSCCGDCCLYPAEHYGTLFDLEDLPDEVVAIGQDDAYEIVFAKSEDEASPYTAEEGLARVTLITGEPNLWDRQGFDAGLNEWFPFEDAGEAQPCLIFAQDENRSYVKDQFFDEYEIAGPDIETATIARVSLCRWEGTTTRLVGSPPQAVNYAVRIEYNSFVDPINGPSPTSCKWTWNGAAKTAPQNGPEGDYDFDGETYSVAEPT